MLSGSFKRAWSSLLSPNLTQGNPVPRDVRRWNMFTRMSLGTPQACETTSSCRRGTEAESLMVNSLGCDQHHRAQDVGGRRAQHTVHHRGQFGTRCLDRAHKNFMGFGDFCCHLETTARVSLSRAMQVGWVGAVPRAAPSCPRTLCSSTRPLDTPMRQSSLFARQAVKFLLSARDSLD